MPVPPPPQQPTFYFVGVSTGQSSSRRVFPRWMAVLGRPEVVLQGVDFPLHDDPANYRAFVAFVLSADGQKVLKSFGFGAP